LLVVVVLIVLAARYAFVRPVAVELELLFGPSAGKVRAANLVFTDAHDRVQRELELRYPTGAPSSDSRRVSLKPGEYTVGVRLTLDAAPARTSSERLRIEQAGRYRLDLSH
jgi:hypothetical protein